jgi:hypothetical protein
VRAALALALALLPAAALGQVGGISRDALPARATAAQLAATSATGTHGLRIVTNALTSASCTVGGGTVRMVCFDNGAGWQPMVIASMVSSAITETAPGTTAGTRCITANTADGAPARLCVAGTTDSTVFGGFAQAVLGNDTGTWPNQSYFFAGSAADGWGAGIFAHYSNLTLDDEHGGIFLGASSDGVNYAILLWGADGLLATSSDGNKPMSIRLDPQAAPPFACDAGRDGVMYNDSSHALCFCDGTTWNKVSGSGAGTCA